MSSIDAGEVAVAGLARQRSRWLTIGRLMRDNPLAVFGLLVIFVLAVCAVFAPLIAPFEPDDLGVGPRNLDPTWKHLFGTEDLGRDMFSRVVFGARISLIVGFSAVIFGTVVGTAIGIFSGYSGGAIDGVIQRTVDTFIAFPGLLILLILRQVLGPSVETLIVAVGSFSKNDTLPESTA